MAKLYQLMMKEDKWVPTYRIGSDWYVHHWTNRKYTKEEIHFMECFEDTRELEFNSTLDLFKSLNKRFIPNGTKVGF